MTILVIKYGYMFWLFLSHRQANVVTEFRYMAKAYKETSKLWYDKQAAPLCPHVILHDANKIVHPFHDSLSVLYRPLILHMLPAQAHCGHECIEGIALLA